MENADSVIVHRIKHNFKWVSGAVKTNNSVFLRKPFNHLGAYIGFKRVKNVLSADIMPKRRFVELNDNIHKESIAWKKAIFKRPVKHAVGVWLIIVSMAWRSQNVDKASNARRRVYEVYKAWAVRP